MNNAGSRNLESEIAQLVIRGSLVPGWGLVVLLALTLGSASPAQTPTLPVLIPNPADLETVIRLNTGEWLKGRIEYLNYARLYFDSNKLGKVNFDWNDVHYLRSTESCEYVFSDDLKIRGRGIVNRESVLLTLPGDEEREFSRSSLLAIYPGSRGQARWIGRISGTLDTTSGNTEENTLDVTAEIRRRAGSLSMEFDFTGSYNEADGDENRRRLFSALQFNYDLTRRLFLAIARTDATYDKFQNLDYRIRLSTGLGVNLIRGNRVNWRIQAGPAQEFVRYREVTGNQSRQESNRGAIFTTVLDWEITNDVDFHFETLSFVSTENSDNANHILTARLSLDLIEDFDLDLTFKYERNENPERDEAGRLPERDDFRFLVGLGYEF